MKDRYRIYTVENVITEESAAIGDYASSDPTPEYDADLAAAIDALESDSWDTVDERDGTVIAYPADYVQDMRTGAYEAAELIIHGAPKDIGHLINLYAARRSAAERRFQEYLKRNR